MAIKNKIIFPILLLSGLGLYCTKKDVTCPKFGYEFTYDKPGVSYSPNLDSFLLGNELIMEASVPKTFFEETKGYYVTLNESTIKGSLGIQKFTNIPGIPIDVAANEFEFSSIEGEIYRDTINHTEGQLKGVRSLLWTSVLDSFRIKIIIKPKVKGTFILGIGQQGNRDTDCALYKYFLKVKNADPHLYYYHNYIGYIPQFNNTYCFKVY